MVFKQTSNMFDFLISPFIPKVFDNYAVTVMIGGEPYTLGLFDLISLVSLEKNL